MTTIRITKTKMLKFIAQAEQWMDAYDFDTDNIKVEYGAGFVGNELKMWVVTKDYNEMKSARVFSMTKGFRNESTPKTREVYKTSFKVNWSANDKAEYSMTNLFKNDKSIIDSIKGAFDDKMTVQIRKTSKDEEFSVIMTGVVK